MKSHKWRQDNPDCIIKHNGVIFHLYYEYKSWQGVSINVHNVCMIIWGSSLSRVIKDARVSCDEMLGEIGKFRLEDYKYVDDKIIFQ